MNKRKVIWTYLILSLLLIFSAVVLALQVKHYLYERTVYEFDDPTVAMEEAKEQLKSEEIKVKNEIITVFNNSVAFRSLATPIPRPSPTPLPPPTPTPIVPASGYKLKYVTGSWVSLQRYDGQSIRAKVGDVVTETFGDFEILEANTRPSWVKVKDVKSGTVRIINQEAPAKTSQQRKRR